jgi:hypothetical protein
MLKSVIYGQKKFYNIGPRGYKDAAWLGAHGQELLKNFFFQTFLKFVFHKTNILEYFLRKSKRKLVSNFDKNIEPAQVKHLSGAPHKGRLLASPTNIRLSRKGLPGTNILTYYENM